MFSSLEPSVLARIKEVLSRFSEIETATLYGSRAKGTHRAASDIDLTLTGETLTVKTLNRIHLALDGLMLPNTFDVSLYHHIANEDLLDHIRRVGKVIYKKEE